MSLRNLLFDLKILKSHTFDLSIITVGNLTVGGTGKTPHVEYITSLLRDKYRIAVLSRGYKRKTHQFVLARPHSPVSEIGDEPKQIHNKFPDVPIAVDKNRTEGINKLQQQFNDLKVVILDDAFQHRYVKPGLAILLIDYNRPITSDYLLPVGRLRESFYEKRRANIVIVTKTPEDLRPMEKRIFKKKLNLFPYQRIFFTRYAYGDPLPVFPPSGRNSENQSSSLSMEPEKYDILLLTGIADPSPIYTYLQNYTSNIQHLNFPDHHQYTSNDMQTVHQQFKDIASNNKIILTTEKDAVRLQETTLPSELQNHIYYLPIHIQFHDQQAQSFDELIMRFVQENKVSILHQ